MQTAAVLHAPGDLRIESRPIPELRPNEVLVEVTAVGICGSDLHYYAHGKIGNFVVNDPLILGHEAAGVISLVGEEVSPELLGRLVAIEPGIPDDTCTQCRTGRYNLCRAVQFHATPPIDGSLANFIAVPQDFVHLAPNNLSAAQAALAEPVSVGIAAARKAKTSVGDRVLVLGAGPVGILTAQIAVLSGARTVVLHDINEQRLDFARELNLSTELPEGEKFDVIFECSGSDKAFRNAVDRCAPAARIVLVGMGSDEYQLPVGPIQNLEISISGLFRYANTYSTALDLLSQGKVASTQLITHRFLLEDTEKALQTVSSDPSAQKVVIVNKNVL